MSNWKQEFKEAFRKPSAKHKIPGVLAYVVEDKTSYDTERTYIIFENKNIKNGLIRIDNHLITADEVIKNFKEVADIVQFIAILKEGLDLRTDEIIPSVEEQWIEVGEMLPEDW